MNDERMKRMKRNEPRRQTLITTFNSMERKRVSELYVAMSDWSSVCLVSLAADSFMFALRDLCSNRPWDCLPSLSCWPTIILIINTVRQILFLLEPTCLETHTKKWGAVQKRTQV